MEIREIRRQDALVLALSGRIDSTTSAPLEKALLERLGAGERRLVVDMGGLDYVSSAGLRVFLLLARKVREVRGGLALCALSPAVRQVFDLAGFSPLFAIEGDVDAASARLAPRTGA